MTKHVSPETALFILDRAIDRELARRRGQQGLADLRRSEDERIGLRRTDGVHRRIAIAQINLG